MTNFRMYGSKTGFSRKAKNCQSARFVRISKTVAYENPYTITGSIKQTGLEEKPTDICTDRIIGTWKVSNVEDLIPRKR